MQMAAVFGTLFVEPIGQGGSIPTGRYDRSRRMYIDASTGQPGLIRCASNSGTSTTVSSLTTTNGNTDSDTDINSDTD